MASRRMSAPVRGVALQLSKLSIRQDAAPKCIANSFSRSISTSTSSKASVSPATITSSASAPLNPIKPLEQQTVLATIHHFPSLEPLRFESYPANHLYLPTRRDILHRAIVYEGDMTRSGTASTKTRYEVRGSARKIRPQKGSGKARLGDKNSPMLRGGGVAFGPKPRDFATGLQKKVYDLAWRTALSYRYRKGELVIVDNAMEIESPSPRLLKDIFDSAPWGASSGRSLLITLEQRPLLERALDAMGRSRQSLTWDEVDVKDLLELSRIVIERDALTNILLSHQEDLTHVSLPWHKGMVKSSPPKDLEAVSGWAEFQHLISLPVAERDEARIDAYEALASSRWQEAAELPDGHPRKNELTISSLELSAMSKDLLAVSPRTRRKLNADGQTSTHGTRLILQTEATEMRVQVLRLRGKHEQADKLWEKAGEMRMDVSAAEVDMSMIKGNECVKRANDLTRRGMYEQAQEAEDEAEEWFAKADQLKEGVTDEEMTEQEIDDYNAELERQMWEADKNKATNRDENTIEVKGEEVYAESMEQKAEERIGEKGRSDVEKK